MQLPIAEADIAIFQGATFNQTLYYETGDPSAPVNLTGYTAKMQIRSTPQSKALILELSSPSSGITLGGSAGSITLAISATTTAALSAQEAVYDLELTTGSTVTRILQGNVIISPEVTR
jgi:hypothetical protein